MVDLKSELKFIFYMIGLYVSFIYWGYLQEKITTTKYKVEEDSDEGTNHVELSWGYPFALNTFMALATFIVATIADVIFPKTSTTKSSTSSTSSSDTLTMSHFALPALTSAAASPLGYAALQYISYPLVILTKSTKPVPVMFVGLIFYGKRYPWHKYVVVFLLCSGISLFSFAKKYSTFQEEEEDILKQLFGILLVGLNLFLDGYTNNQQDTIFESGKVNTFQMMKYVNMWQMVYLIIYLLLGWYVWGSGSELANAWRMIVSSSHIRYDILMFCLCASSGQLFIFKIMKDYGSLVWVTLSITRKFVTILLSVIIFKHAITFYQWIGVSFVFAGMCLEVIMNYLAKKTSAAEKPSLKKD